MTLNQEEFIKDLVSDDDNDSKNDNYTVQAKRRKLRRRSKSISPTKLALSNAMNIDFDRVPDYLSKANPSFERKIGSILPPTIHIDDLRRIALLMYKILSLQFIQSLWTMYQKSCLGQLPSDVSSAKDIDTKVSPIEVQSNMKLCQLTFQNDESNPSLIFVNHCLNEFNGASEHYRQHLNMKTSRLVAYTRALEHNIEKFVQQGLASKRIHIDHAMALVQYHFTDVLLKRTYLAQHPSEIQIKIMKQFCQRKYNQEITKHEANFLKQQIPRHLNSHPFEKESIGQLSIIEDMKDRLLQQQLYKQYKDTAEQGRTKIMALHLECAETQKSHCQKQSNKEEKEFWTTEKTLPYEQQLTPTMRNLIDQRLANMTARIECLYKFKTQLLTLEWKSS